MKAKKAIEVRMPEVINIDEHHAKKNPILTEKNPVSTKSNWINELRLTEDHENVLQSTEWLDDDLINASQRILENQFQNKFGKAGFQATAIGLCGNYIIETGEFVQFCIMDLTTGW